MSNFKDYLGYDAYSVLRELSKDNFNSVMGGDNYLFDVSTSYWESQNMEQEHIDDLEQLASMIVREMFPFIEDHNVELSAHLGINPIVVNENVDSGIPNSTNIDPNQFRKRRLINAITQGASLRGSNAFHMYSAPIEDINPKLISNYSDITKYSYGSYDSDSFVGMCKRATKDVSNLMAFGAVKTTYHKETNSFTVEAKANTFPILLQELIKGIYEILSLQGFEGSKEENEEVVKHVDTLYNEIEDIRYGKYIYDKINNLLWESGSSEDSRIREYFLMDLYKLPAEDFILFVENLIKGELNAWQVNWAKNTFEDIVIDLKHDSSI